MRRGLLRVRKEGTRGIREEIPYVPVSDQFESHKLKDDNWTSLKAVWAPEQTAMAKEKFGKIFDEYFCRLEEATPRERLESELAMLKDQKNKRIPDIRKVEILLQTVLLLESRNRQSSMADRAVRSGSGWQVTSSDLARHSFDEYYPFVVKDLSPEEVKEARKVCTYLTEIVKANDISQRWKLYEATLLVKAVLCSYPHTHPEWDDFIRLVKSTSTSRVHPNVMEIVLNTLERKWLHLQNELRNKAPADYTKRSAYHDAVSKEVTVVRESLFGVVGWLLSMHKYGYEFARKMYIPVFSKIMAVLPEHDAPLLIATSKDLITEPSHLIAVILQLTQRVEATKVRGRSVQLKDDGLPVKSIVRSIGLLSDAVFTHKGWGGNAGSEAIHGLLLLMTTEYGSWSVQDRELACFQAIRLMSVWLREGHIVSMDWMFLKKFMSNLQAVVAEMRHKPSQEKVHILKSFIKQLLDLPDFPFHDASSWRVLLHISEWTLSSAEHKDNIDVFIVHWGLVSAENATGPCVLDEGAPCNLLLSRVTDPQQTRTVLGLIGQSGSTISKGAYLKLFQTYVSLEQWDEGVHLWDSMSNAPKNTKAALILRAAQCLCMSSYLSSSKSELARASELLTNSLENWALNSKSSDKPRAQFKSASQIFKKTLPKDLYIKELGGQGLGQPALLMMEGCPGQTPNPMVEVRSMVAKLEIELEELKEREKMYEEEAVDTMEGSESMEREVVIFEELQHKAPLLMGLEAGVRGLNVLEEALSWQKLASKFLQIGIPKRHTALPGAVVRSSATVDARKTLRQMKEGSVVVVEEVAGNWAKISTPVKGWVWRTHLKPMEESEVTSPGDSPLVTPASMPSVPELTPGHSNESFTRGIDTLEVCPTGHMQLKQGNRALDSGVDLEDDDSLFGLRPTIQHGSIGHSRLASYSDMDYRSVGSAHDTPGTTGTEGICPVGLEIGDYVKMRDNAEQAWKSGKVHKVCANKVSIRRDGYAGVNHWRIVRLVKKGGPGVKEIRVERECSQDTLGLDMDHKTLTINSVDKESPASRAGLRSGMRIRHVAGMAVASMMDIKTLLRQAGTSLTISVEVQEERTQDVGQTAVATPPVTPIPADTLGSSRGDGYGYTPPVNFPGPWCYPANTSAPLALSYSFTPALFYSWMALSTREKANILLCFRYCSGKKVPQQLLGIVTEYYVR